MWQGFKIGFICIVACIPLNQAPAQDTNPAELQAWFKALTNRQGGQCCGEADAYAAIVTKMPRAVDENGRESYLPDGEAVIVDTGTREIWVHGVLIKTRPAWTRDPHIHFSWMQMTREKYGNPLDHAIVFVNISNVTREDGTTIPYCVVILPQIF
jgi:hypothetical protein